jgi:hypothetical protein
MIVSLARFVILSAVMMTTCLHCIAQTSAVSRELPDAPSASQQSDRTAPAEPVKDESSVGLLMKRSRVFPDLATSKGPLTSGQKFKLSVNNTLSPASVAGSLLGAGLSQAMDSYPDYGQGAAGFGKRFGSSMGRSASRQFFGTYVFASVLHQDPRYFPIKDASLKQSMAHALRRVVITPTDDGGHAPNYSGLLGILAAETLANAYVPDDDRTAGKTFKRTGKSIAIRAGTNMLKEYWPTIFKRLRPKPAQQN